MDLEEKYKEEASAIGIEYIGHPTPKKLNYRLYRCKQGHEVLFQTTHVRRNNIKCPVCYEEGLVRIAEAIGYKLLGPSERGPYFRVYQKDCGCIEDLRIASVAKTKGRLNSGINMCKTCYRKSLYKAANESGIELLEDIDTYNIRIRFKACGHFKNAKKTQVLKKNLVCRECIEILYSQEAEKQGLVMHPFTSWEEVKGEYRTYTLPCGCDKQLRPSHVKESRWECTFCDDSHYIKPSLVYLLKLNLSNGKQVLKLGYAREIQTRVWSCGLDGDFEVLYTVNFSTGKEAYEFERNLHKKYRESKIDKNIMYQFMNNGATECYHLDMLDILLNELKLKESLLLEIGEE